MVRNQFFPLYLRKLKECRFNSLVSKNVFLQALIKNKKLVVDNLVFVKYNPNLVNKSKLKPKIVVNVFILGLVNNDKTSDSISLDIEFFGN